MAKRSISKTFRHDQELIEILDWVAKNLPCKTYDNGETHYLTQKILITVVLDADKIGSLLPEGPKDYTRK